MQARNTLTPTVTTSSLTPLTLRTDLPREDATHYWAHEHSELVRGLPYVSEYNQLHFSQTDHGYWPASATVGTRTPEGWHLDGAAELRFPSAVGQLRNLPHVRKVYYDEQNVFEMVTGYVTGQGGGRWWTTGLDETLEHRTVVLLRQRKGTSTRSLRTFVHDRLGPALHAAGAQDLRTYTFATYRVWQCNTPGVLHECPPHRRHHAAAVFGARSRDGIEEIIASPELKPVLEEQHLYLTGAHAYTVDKTIPGIRINRG